MRPPEPRKTWSGDEVAQTAGKVRKDEAGQSLSTASRVKLILSVSVSLKVADDDDDTDEDEGEVRATGFEVSVVVTSTSEQSEEEYVTTPPQPVRSEKSPALAFSSFKVKSWFTPAPLQRSIELQSSG